MDGLWNIYLMDEEKLVSKFSKIYNRGGGRSENLGVHINTWGHGDMGIFYLFKLGCAMCTLCSVYPAYNYYLLR